MIKGVKKTPLTVENILKRISEYDIFRYYMSIEAKEKDWKLNKGTFSPFRDEDNPSFLIGNKNGYLSFIDFTDTSKRGDCFTFVKMLYPGLENMDSVLKKIDKDFGLGILPQNNSGEYKKILSQYSQPEEETGKHYSVIQVITRKFTNEELAYWNEYYQDITDLRREHIYSVAKVYLNRQLFPLSDTELRFGYLYDNHWKIYRPFGGKKSKWIPNNVPITAMDGKTEIINCKTAFINKSKKDYMVIRKIFPTTCAVQNEGLACFSEENVSYLKSNSQRQILSFDSDVPGVQNSQQITQMFGFGYCNVPRKYLPDGIKDWAQLAHDYGLETVRDYLKERGIYD